ncbi:MAG: hypothetical protein EBS01_11505 [Verrucomicrobia bacterium]|nr:hypothetical protein [Verrucomicrobiota bacterium]
MTVNKATPAIVSWPAASAITSGQTLSSSVLSGGSASVAGTFAFTSPSSIPGIGTSLQAVIFTPADSSRYSAASGSVSVTVNPVGRIPVITSALAAAGNVGAVFNYQITGTNSPSTFTAPALPPGLTINSTSGLISGTPTAAGQSAVTIGAINSTGTGSATLTLSILSAGTNSAGTNTVSWPDLYGTYEGLLLHTSDAGSEDGAVYRGSFVMTLRGNGVVSGRVMYNEARLLDDVNRLYAPVTRAFSGVLTASATNPLVYRKVVKLGTATSRGSEELTLEVSFETAPATVNVTVRDFVSPADGDPEWVSQSLGCSRSIVKLPTAAGVGGGSLDYSKAPGHYTLYATDQDPTGMNDAFVMVQLLTTGKIVWMSRTKGVLGTGSAGLRLSEGGVSAAFYEGRLSSTPTAWKTTSLLGNLDFAADSVSGDWVGHFDSDALPGRVERHASYIFRSGYNESDGQNWTITRRSPEERV